MGIDGMEVATLMNNVTTSFGNGEYAKLKSIAGVLHAQRQIKNPTLYALNKWWLRELILIMEKKGVI